MLPEQFGNQHEIAASDYLDGEVKENQPESWYNQEKYVDSEKLAGTSKTHKYFVTRPLSRSILFLSFCLFLSEARWLYMRATEQKFEKKTVALGGPGPLNRHAHFFLRLNHATDYNYPSMFQIQVTWSSFLLSQYVILSTCAGVRRTPICSTLFVSSSPRNRPPLANCALIHSI